MPEAAAPSLKRNYFLNLLVSLANVAYPLLTLTYASRVLGPETLGRFFIAQSLAAYFALVAGLGLPLYGAREAAKARGDREALGRLFSELFLINAVSSLLCAALFTAAVLSVGEFRQHAALFLLLGSAVALNLFTVDFLFMGVEDYASIARRSLVTKGVSLALLFPLVRGPEDLLPYAAWTVFGTALYALWGFRNALRLTRLRLADADWRRHLRPLAVVAGMIALVSAYTSLDSVILGLVAGAEDVGLYNAGLKVNRILVALVTSAGMVMIPRIAHYLSRDMHREFEAAAAKSLDLICLFTFPAAAFVLASAPGICELVFGPRFAEAAPAMRIIAPMVVVVGFTHFIGMQVLFPKGEERILFVSMALAAAVGTALNLALSPRFGHVGAAWAILGAETAVLLVQWPVFRKKYATGGILRVRTLSYALAAPLAALPVLALQRAGLDARAAVIAGVVLGSAAYAAALLAARDPLSREIAALAFARIRRP